MDPNASHHEDKLSAFERRLAEWRPDSEGLHADQMLYAAGLAAGQRGKRSMLWPTLCLCFGVVSAASLSWGFFERAEFQAMASRIHEQERNLSVAAAPALADSATSAYSPASNDYFHLRKQMEQHPGEWLASSQQINPAEALPVKSDILKAGQYDRWRDQ